MKLFNPPQAEADTSRLSSSGCFVTGQQVLCQQTWLAGKSPSMSVFSWGVFSWETSFSAGILTTLFDYSSRWTFQTQQTIQAPMIRRQRPYRPSVNCWLLR